MRVFSRKKKTPKSIAKERLSNLLLAERMDCSPRMMLMMKNDVTQTINRYIPVNEEDIICQIKHTPAVLVYEIPIKRTEDTHVKTL
jgi:cell division topological specificity factor